MVLYISIVLDITIFAIIMHFPSDIEAQIKQFAQPRAATLREDWREGSSIINIIKQDPLWTEWQGGGGAVAAAGTGVELYLWCKIRGFIVPASERAGHNDPTYWEPITHPWERGYSYDKLPGWVIRQFIDEKIAALKRAMDDTEAFYTAQLAEIKRERLEWVG